MQVDFSLAKIETDGDDEGLRVEWVVSEMQTELFKKSTGTQTTNIQCVGFYLRGNVIL